MYVTHEAVRFYVLVDNTILKRSRRTSLNCVLRHHVVPCLIEGRRQGRIRGSDLQHVRVWVCFGGCKTEYRIVPRCSDVRLYWRVVRRHSILGWSIFMYILYDMLSTCSLRVTILYVRNMFEISLFEATINLFHTWRHAEHERF